MNAERTDLFGDDPFNRRYRSNEANSIPAS